jgi:rRNA maturation RNase YbeY
LSAGSYGRAEATWEHADKNGAPPDLQQLANAPQREPKRTLTLHNHQRLQRLDLRLWRRITTALLQELWPNGGLDLAVHVVTGLEITRLNETFLQHQGSTDVITFDYTETAGQDSRRPPRPRGRVGRETPPRPLHGEIFVCLDEAVCQARRFRATWQSELVRYAVHGVLHLLGYDDLNCRARRRMKAAENRLMRRLARQFTLDDLGASPAGPQAPPAANKPRRFALRKRPGSPRLAR